MFTLHPLVQLTLTRIREFTREPEAVFWAVFFPILLAAGLGIAFAGRPASVAESRGRVAGHRARRCARNTASTSPN